MPYFQNITTSEFQGSLVIGDRKQVTGFNCPRHSGRGDEMAICFNPGPYDLDGNDLDGNDKSIFKIAVSTDASSFTAWDVTAIDVSIAAANDHIVSAQDIVTALMGNNKISSLFEISTVSNGTLYNVKLKQKLSASRIKFYIINGGAESVLRFNAKSGIAELPTYMNRHTVNQSTTYPDSVGMLVRLDMTKNEDRVLVQDAGFSGTEKSDWELMTGRSGLFQFSKKIDDKTKIVYSAGAGVGDVATKYVEDNDGNTFQLPYTLTDDDLVTPP